MDLAKRATELLRQMLPGSSSMFRDGQLDAILSCAANRKRQLLVQKTGWGKSFVYFIATKILRENGGGPTLLISPLLSLIRNQVSMAGRIGIRAQNIDSTNSAHWGEITRQLQSDQCDVLLISPERLASESFHARVLPAISKGIGLFVVDEAHCISDWGHDFRPDYRRISRFVLNTPRAVPVLATTATANDRVVRDIVQQLGSDLQVVRGPLTRESLGIQCIHLKSKAERMGWLAQYLGLLPGSGIIYCLTTRDCDEVAEWLQSHGIVAGAYHAGLGKSDEERNTLREVLEQRLLQNQVKALVSTVALGMGFDKPDLGFVVHFQRPGSIVSYYQQIGRAGRAIDKALAILLHGDGDDDVTQYFIDTAFPSEDVIEEVLNAIEQSESGLTIAELEEAVNYSQTKIKHCLKFLIVESAVVKMDQRFCMTPTSRWKPNPERARQITAIRLRELEDMRAFCALKTCYMRHIAQRLDDPRAKNCGKCSNCRGYLVPWAVDPKQSEAAAEYIKKRVYFIVPHSVWPVEDAGLWNSKSIAQNLAVEKGRALCRYGDAGWGQAVQEGKYHRANFGGDLIAAAVDLIGLRWKPSPLPTWITAVPSLRRPTLVMDMAKHIARELQLPFRKAVVKVRDTQEQKTMQNSIRQLRNLIGAFEIDKSLLLPGPVLLIDDIVDSGWTMAYLGALLREAGAERVYPFALAMAFGR